MDQAVQQMLETLNVRIYTYISRIIDIRPDQSASVISTFEENVNGLIISLSSRNSLPDACDAHPSTGVLDLRSGIREGHASSQENRDVLDLIASAHAVVQPELEAVELAFPEFFPDDWLSEHEWLLQPLQDNHPGASSHTDCTSTQRSSLEAKRSVQGRRARLSTFFNHVKKMDVFPTAGLTIFSPEQVEIQLMTGANETQRHHALFLVELFYAIGSPESLVQLRTAFEPGTRGLGLRYPHQADKAVETFIALDSLEADTLACSIMRRFHLLRLHDHRESKLQLIQNKEIPLLKDCPENGVIPSCSRPDVDAIRYLMREICPQSPMGSEEYKCKHRCLKNRLFQGGNWARLRAKFGSGSVAIVPTGGALCIQNQRLESTPAAMFERFLEMLENQRGHYIKSICSSIESVFHHGQVSNTSAHSPFEILSKEVIYQQKHDSPELIRICRLLDAPEA